MGTRYFTPKLFAFLKDLANNNDRDWFNANKDRYEAHVRQPALDFITDFATPLAKISDHFEADSRTVGGSLFRIHRDTRFSKDKTPYKINTGMHFRHEAAKDAHAPGFYIHLEPGNCFFGAGIWRPATPVAASIRETIAEDPKAWKKAIGTKRFADYTFGGESLKRPPKGFDPDHELIEDLKRKDFIVTTKLTQAQVTSGDFSGLIADHCRRTSPLVQVLCRATHVPF